MCLFAIHIFFFDEVSVEIFCSVLFCFSNQVDKFLITAFSEFLCKLHTSPLSDIWFQIALPVYVF